MLLTFVGWPSLRRYRAASKTEPKLQLTDEQWLLIADLFPWKPPHPQGRTPHGAAAGLPGGHSVGAADRRPMERLTNLVPVVCHLLATVARVVGRRRLPEGLEPTAPQARRDAGHQLGRSDGRWDVFPGQRRGDCVGKTKRGKGTKLMVLVDGNGTPLAAEIASASPNEVTLIEPLLDKRVLQRKPRRLIYDKAADSDPLRNRLGKRGIELICPHRKNRTRPKTQDGRAMRRYKRRWKVERSIAWLQSNRRLVARYEHYAHLFHGFVQLACMYTILQRF